MTLVQEETRARFATVRPVNRSATSGSWARQAGKGFLAILLQALSAWAA